MVTNEIEHSWTPSGAVARLLHRNSFIGTAEKISRWPSDVRIRYQNLSTKTAETALLAHTHTGYTRLRFTRGIYGIRPSGDGLQRAFHTLRDRARLQVRSLHDFPTFSGEPPRSEPSIRGCSKPRRLQQDLLNSLYGRWGGCSFGRK